MPPLQNLFKRNQSSVPQRSSFIDRLRKRRTSGQQGAAISAPSSTIDVKKIQASLVPNAPRSIPQSPADKKVVQNVDKLPAPRPPVQQAPTAPPVAQTQAIQQQASQAPPVAPQVPQVAPPTFQPRPVDPKIQALRDRITTGISPTTEEADIQKQISGILTGQELGSEAIRTQPIPTTFLRGQEAALQRQTGIQTAPLQRQLALLQQQRQAEVTGAETALDFRQTDAETQQTQREEFEKGTRQEAILGLINQGVTDAAELSEALPGVSPEEIFDILKANKEVAKEEATLETSIVQAGGRSLLVNTQTGETVRDLGVTEGSLARAATAKLAQDKANQARDLGEDTNPFLAQLGEVATGVVTDLTGRIGISTVGPGALITVKIPGTPAFDFAADLETLKADVGFGILQQMREASKTGGALGQVSERELSFLQNTLASINQFQSIGNFEKNLGKVQESIDRWTNAVAQDTPTGAGSFTTSGGNEVTITEI